MNYKVGDKVKYLNDTGGGIIKRIIDKKLVEIEDENGFIVPVLKSELIVIVENNIEEVETQTEPYVQNNSYNYAERDQWDYLEPEDDNEIISLTDSINFYVAFVPDKPKEGKDDINLFVINDSQYQVLYSVTTEDTEGYVLLEAGKLEANTKVYISTYKRSDLNGMNTFNIQAVFYKNGYYMLRQPVSKDFKVKPAKFFKESLFIKNEFFNNDAYILPVYVEDKQEAEKISNAELKNLIERKKNEDIIKKSNHKFKKISNKEQLEIDLHIEKIIDNYVGLTNGEIVNIQLNHFRKHMEAAIVNKVKRVVFIHGIGNGTLKFELRKILDEEYHNHAYQDASFKEYGFGATMVII